MGRLLNCLLYSLIVYTPIYYSIIKVGISTAPNVEHILLHPFKYSYLLLRTIWSCLLLPLASYSALLTA
jgi:hypothetical protein